VRRISRGFGATYLSKRLDDKVYSRKHYSCDTESAVQIITASSVRQVAKT
jgi:hypothetical protein